MAEELETSKNESKWGGPREGAGRKLGIPNKATLDQKIVSEEIRQRVMNNAQRLIDAQFSLAQGCSYLYKIEKDEKGKNKKPELVKDPEIIERYLNGDFEGDPEEYYYITTDKPSGWDIANLLDRTLGKPKDVMPQGDGDNSGKYIQINFFDDIIKEYIRRKENGKQSEGQHNGEVLGESIKGDNRENSGE